MKHSNGAETLAFVMEYDAEMALYTLRFVLVCIGDDAVDRGIGMDLCVICGT